jgi:hypothetical protein
MVFPLLSRTANLLEESTVARHHGGFREILLEGRKPSFGQAPPSVGPRQGFPHRAREGCGIVDRHQAARNPILD